MSELELSKYFLTKKIPYVRPLYNIDINNDSDVLDWFREATYGLTEYFRPLFREQKSNLAFFIGAGVNPNWSSPYTQIYANTSDIFSSTEQIFINDLYRLVMDQVTLIISHELVPDVLPNSEDYSDKVACNIVKDWLESMNYTLGTEAWRFRWEVQKKMFGESFAIVMWNPQMGDIHPLAKKYIEEDIDMVDEEGNPISDIGQNPVKLRKNMRIGDIEIINPMPWDVMLDPQVNPKDSNWFWWVEYLDVDYLKKKYPDFEWDTRTDRGPDIQYDFYTNTEKENPNKRLVYYLYHKSHEFMPEGRFIVCSNDHIMINEPLSMPTIINNQDFPMVHFKDLDIGMGNRGSPILLEIAKIYQMLTIVLQIKYIIIWRWNHPRCLFTNHLESMLKGCQMAPFRLNGMEILNPLLNVLRRILLPYSISGKKFKRRWIKQLFKILSLREKRQMHN